MTNSRTHRRPLPAGFRVEVESEKGVDSGNLKLEAKWYAAARTTQEDCAKDGAADPDKIHRNDIWQLDEELPVMHNK